MAETGRISKEQAERIKSRCKEQYRRLFKPMPSQSYKALAADRTMLSNMSDDDIAKYTV